MISADQANEPTLFWPGSLIPRRLLTRLDDLLTGKVATIVAPAGYHKTGLVRTWFKSHPQLDDLAIALVLRADQPITDAERLREPLAGLPPGDDPVVIWCDNHDRIGRPQVLHEIMDLVEANPRYRLILAGRTRPNIPLTALALRGDLVELTAADLALTTQEVEAILAASGAEFGLDGLARVHESYRGWPIAVELVLGKTLSWANVPAMIATIEDYIEDEVFEEITPEQLAFLQDVACMTELTPAAAAHLTGRPDAGAQLARLAAAGVPLEWDEGNVIRFNPAVRRYLCRRLETADPERFQAQNRLASQWLRSRGKRQEALQQAIDAHDVELTYDLLTEIVVASLGERETDLLRWFDATVTQLPPSFLQACARSVMLVVAQPDTANMRAVRALYDQMPPDATPNERARLWTITLLVARLTCFRREPELVAQAVEFATRVLTGEVLPSLLDTTVLLLELGIHHLLHGDLAAAQDALQESASHSRILGIAWVAAAATGALSLTEAQLGNTRTAERLAEESLRVAEGATPWITDCPRLALATVAIDRGEIDQAATQLALVSARGVMRELKPVQATVTSYLHLLRDDAREALAAVEACRTASENEATWSQRVGLTIAAATALVQLGDLAQAQTVFDQLREQPVPVGDLAGVATAGARLMLARGLAAEAYESTRAALADPTVPQNTKGYLHLVMTHGVAASQLGRTEDSLAAFQRAGVLAERLGLAGPGTLHTRAATALRPDRISLTQAEQNVLVALAGRGSLTDVATELYISQNTLKTHLRRIYRKMGVASRQEAVDRARMMGLV